MSENRSHIKPKEKQKVFKTISKQLLPNQNVKLLPLLIEEYFFTSKEVNGFGIKTLNSELSYQYLNSTFHSGLDIIYKLCNNLLIKRLRKTDNVIDCGCGTGIISKLIIDHVLEIIVMDIDPSAIESAKQNIQNKEKLRFLIHDFTNDIQIVHPKVTAIVCNPPFFVVKNDSKIPVEALGWLMKEEAIPKMFSFFKKNLVVNGRLFLLFSEWSSYNLFLKIAENYGFRLVYKQSVKEWNDYFQQNEQVYLFEMQLA